MYLYLQFNSYCYISDSLLLVELLEIPHWRASVLAFFVKHILENLWWHIVSLLFYSKDFFSFLTILISVCHFVFMTWFYVLCFLIFFILYFTGHGGIFTGYDELHENPFQKKHLGKETWQAYTYTFQCSFLHVSFGCHWEVWSVIDSCFSLSSQHVSCIWRISKTLLSWYLQWYIHKSQILLLAVWQLRETIWSWQQICGEERSFFSLCFCVYFCISDSNFFFLCSAGCYLDIFYSYNPLFTNHSHLSVCLCWGRLHNGYSVFVVRLFVIIDQQIFYVYFRWLNLFNPPNSSTMTYTCTMLRAIPLHRLEHLT